MSNGQILHEAVGAMPPVQPIYGCVLTEVLLRLFVMDIVDSSQLEFLGICSPKYGYICGPREILAHNSLFGEFERTILREALTDGCPRKEDLIKVLSGEPEAGQTDDGSGEGKGKIYF
jgi:hypothetical protein